MFVFCDRLGGYSFLLCMCSILSHQKLQCLLGACAFRLCRFVLGKLISKGLFYAQLVQGKCGSLDSFFCFANVAYM